MNQMRAFTRCMSLAVLLTGFVTAMSIGENATAQVHRRPIEKHDVPPGIGVNPYGPAPAPYSAPGLQAYGPAPAPYSAPGTQAYQMPTAPYSPPYSPSIPVPQTAIPPQVSMNPWATQVSTICLTSAGSCPISATMPGAQCQCFDNYNNLYVGAAQ